MSITVSHEGTYKEATGMWVSMGGVWHEVATGGGGAPPSSAAVAQLSVNIDKTLTVLWANAVINVPVPMHYEVLLGPTSDPQVLPTEWAVVGTVPFVAGPLVQNTWTGPDPAAAPGSYTYAMVVSVGHDEARSSPTYTNPVLADPLPTEPLAFAGVWASLAENYLFWEPPVELDAMVEYVVHYSTEPIPPGGGTFLAAVTRGVEVYTHVKAAAEQDMPLWYTVFCRRADGLLGPQATTMVEKGVVPPPAAFSAVGTSPSVVALTWGPPPYLADATGYRLIFKTGSYPTSPTDPAATVLLDNSPLNVRTYSHTGLAQQTTYYYMLCCNSPSGYGMSTIDSATTPKPPPPVPGAVVNYDLTPGLMWCWFYVSWGQPTNTSEISYYDIRCQANTAPGGGGTFVRTVFPGSTTSYLRTVYETFVTAPTMGISTAAFNQSGTGPWANGTSTLGGFAQSLCTYAYREPGLYNPRPGRVENLDLAWVENFYRATGRPMPRDINEAWNTITWLLEEDNPDYDGWWCRILMALDVTLWMDKPSPKAWERANGILQSKRHRGILAYWEVEIHDVVDRRDKNVAVLALTECMSALGTEW